MKKLLFILSLILLFSCEKPRCKECVTLYYKSMIHVGVEVDRYVDCGGPESIPDNPGNTFPMYITTCK